MNINNVLYYLTNKNVFKHRVRAKQINVGSSGAKLYLIKDGRKKYVLKIMHESFCNQANQFELFKREFLFYELSKELKLPYIPNVVYSEIHNEYGIVLLLEYYEAVKHKQWNIQLQKQAIDICAHFNCMDKNKILKLNLCFDEHKIDEKAFKNSYQEWKLVLNQHSGYFDKTMIDEIYKNINIVCPILNREPHYICHGDFHPENILTDGNQVYVCDWQNISIGKGIGDVSFFISRGTGFGIEMNEDELLEYYCEKLSVYSKVNISKDALLKEKYASALLCSFSSWAYYLKNSSCEKVEKQFNEMVNAYKYLAYHS